MESLFQYVEGDDSPPPQQIEIVAREEVKPTTSGRKDENEVGSAEQPEELDPEAIEFRLRLPEKSVAPPVSDSLIIPGFSGSSNSSALVEEKKPLALTQHSVNFNPTFDQLWAPVVGPAHPFIKDGLSRGSKNHKMGVVDDTAIEPFMFDEQYNTFQAFGYGVDPSSSGGKDLVGDFEKFEEMGGHGATVYNLSQTDHKLIKKRKKGDMKGKEVKTEENVPENQDSDEEETLNPASEAWLLKNTKSPWSGKVTTEENLPEELTEEQKKYAKEHAEKKARKDAKKGREQQNAPVVEPKSTFHGKEEKDYQGRSWLAPPTDQNSSVDHCYIPKKWVHTWSGHTKGVSAIRFFPKYGHLLLSASMDTKIKIWDVPNSGKCLRTYMGHGKAVQNGHYWPLLAVIGHFWFFQFQGLILRFQGFRITISFEGFGFWD